MMKKLLYLLFLPLLLLTSCDMESSDNGELDAMWYLVKVDSVKSGATRDYRDKRIMWSFQGDLLQMNKTERFNAYYMAYFKNEDGYLKLSTPFLFDRVKGDEILTEDRLEEVRRFGINSLEENFRIETLNSSQMILKDDVLRLTFERY